jgi:hypothetical protein
MEAISSQSASSAIALNNMSASEGLTGEALMFWLSSRLQSIDSDIDAMMKHQTSALKKKEVLQQYQHSLMDMQENLDRGDQAGAQQALDDYAAFVRELPVGSPERALAQQKLDSYKVELAGYDKKTGKFPEGGRPYNKGEFTTEIESLKSEIGSLDKDSELLMIRINQLMSQRQTAVQLAQAIMNKQNETISSIVQKMG